MKMLSTETVHRQGTLLMCIILTGKKVFISVLSIFGKLNFLIVVKDS